MLTRCYLLIVMLAGCAGGPACQPSATVVHEVEQPAGCEEAPYTMKMNVPPMVNQ